jgi:hypothetical protein
LPGVGACGHHNHRGNQNKLAHESLRHEVGRRLNCFVTWNM